MGLTFVSSHDEDQRSAEGGGVYLWSRGRDSRTIKRIVLLGTDWCFDELGLETLTATVARDNLEQIELNETLGHVFDPDVEGSPVRTCRLTREAYQRVRPGLVRDVTSIEGFGIRLRRLTREDLEMVRHWRNDPEIRQYMAFKEHITEEMQLRWFESVDNENNHYSIVEWGGRPIGLSHVKDCDWKAMTGEGGLFLWDRDFRDSTYAMRVAIVGSDWCFRDVGLKVIKGTVMKGNKRAIRFNKALGHVFDPEPPDSDVLTCRLTVDAYEKARPRLVALFG